MHNGGKNGIDARIKEALLQAASDGKITCPAAMEIATSLDVEPKVVGEACNELKIKLYGCALGCF